MKRRLRQGGFTMVEVMVVIAIVGILAAIAVPSLLGTLPRRRLSDNATTLANEISVMRVRAIAKSARFKVAFVPAAGTYTLSREVGGAWSPMATGKVSGSTLTAVASFRDANAVIAEANGTMNVAFNSQGTVTLSTPDGAFQKRVVVEPIGRVFLERSGDAGSTWTRE